METSSGSKIYFWGVLHHSRPAIEPKNVIAREPLPFGDLCGCKSRSPFTSKTDVDMNDNRSIRPATPSWHVQHKHIGRRFLGRSEVVCLEHQLHIGTYQGLYEHASQPVLAAGQIDAVKRDYSLMRLWWLPRSEILEFNPRSQYGYSGFCVCTVQYLTLNFQTIPTQASKISMAAESYHDFGFLIVGKITLSTIWSTHSPLRRIFFRLPMPM